MRVVTGGTHLALDGPMFDVAFVANFAMATGTQLTGRAFLQQVPVI